MKDQPFRFKRHFLKLWKANIFFCEAADGDSLIKRFNFKFGPGFEYKNCDGFAWKQSRKDTADDYYLVVRPGVKDSVIIHECVHLAMFILSDRGVNIEVENDEPLAYLVEYLFDEAKAFLLNNPNKIPENSDL